MIGSVGFLVVFVLYILALVSFCGWAQRKVKPWVYSLSWAVWCTVWFCLDIFLYHDQFGAALNAFVGSYWWRDFWKKKPPFNRKKVEQLVGAKTKALKQKLVDAMPKASPLGKPVLVPAGV